MAHNNKVGPGSTTHSFGTVNKYITTDLRAFNHFSDRLKAKQRAVHHEWLNSADRERFDQAFRNFMRSRVRMQTPIQSATQWIRLHKGTPNHKASAEQVVAWMKENKHLFTRKKKK
jgi:hypothetical protein